MSDGDTEQTYPIFLHVGDLCFLSEVFLLVRSLLIEFVVFIYVISETHVLKRNLTEGTNPVKKELFAGDIRYH